MAGDLPFEEILVIHHEGVGGASVAEVDEREPARVLQRFGDRVEIRMGAATDGVVTAGAAPEVLESLSVTERHGWWVVGTPTFPQGSYIGAVSRSTDKLDIFGTDTGGRVITAAWEPAFSDGWHGWWNLNGGKAAHGSLITAESRRADFLDVFVVGMDGRAYAAAWSPGQPWGGWWPMGK